MMPLASSSKVSSWPEADAVESDGRVIVDVHRRLVRGENRQAAVGADNQPAGIRHPSALENSKRKVAINRRPSLRGETSCGDGDRTSKDRTALRESAFEMNAARNVFVPARRVPARPGGPTSIRGQGGQRPRGIA